MARSLLPFVQNGYYASRNWIPLVKGNGFTTSGGGEQEEVWETASGPIVTFDAVAAPLRQLSVSVEPVQNLNGYDNPWPAGGGKNILPITEWFDVGYTQTINGVTMTVNADGSLTFSGTSTANAEFQLSSKVATPPSNPLTVAAGTYTISQSGIPTGVKFITSGGGGNGFPYTELTSANTSATGTVTDGTVPFNYFIVRIPANTSSNGTYKFQLELGSSATAWTPYSNICPISGWDSVNIWDKSTHDTTATPTATIQLGETVYGGTLDVVNGKMTVDRAFYVWQSGGYLTSTNAFAINKSDVVQINSQNQTTLVGAICDKLQSGTWEYIAARTNKFSAGCVYGNGLAIRIPGLTTAEEYTAWLAENTPSFCYKLATPFELTLTPEQISTLQGTNNVWSDAGDVTVEYRSQ